MNFQFHAARLRCIDPHANPEILLLCNIFFFFVPIFYRSSSLSAHSAAWRGCAEYVGCLLSLFFLPPPLPIFLRVGPSLRPPPHYQRASSDAEEPPADTHNTDGMKCSAVISLSPSLPLFLSPRTLLRLCFSLPPHKLLISALSSISAANKRPVSCTSPTSAPAPDRVSASHHAEAFCYFHHRASCSTPRLQT